MVPNHRKFELERGYILVVFAVVFTLDLNCLFFAKDFEIKGVNFRKYEIYETPSIVS